jgi:uncharacterized protein DUF6799
MAHIMSLSIIIILAFQFATTGTNAAEMQGLMMIGGRVVVVAEGKPGAALDHEATLSNGTKVEPDGTVKFSNGNQVRLHEHDSITADGHIMGGGKAAAMQQ